jgi:hypothetical protein
MVGTVWQIFMEVTMKFVPLVVTLISFFFFFGNNKFELEVTVTPICNPEDL